MQPSAIRLPAPNAEAGMKVGRLSAATAAAELFRKSRRVRAVGFKGMVGMDFCMG